MLFASGADIHSFGAARGIKHLMVQMCNPHCDHLSSAMSGLEQLETLWLAESSSGRVQPQASGALQLSGLRNLRSLALINVAPETISCTDSCELHVELDAGWSITHPVWDTVLSRLRSVRLGGRSTELAALPSILLEADNLTRAVVIANCCGTATAPLLLGGSLAHVETFRLECVEVHAVVPAHVTWRNCFVAATHLNLRFAAVASFGEAIPAFFFRFKELQVWYPKPSPNLSWP